MLFRSLVEAHGHIGLDGWAVGYEGKDYNEYNDPVTPQLRAIDGINPFDESLRDAALGGVTTLCTGPGSSNVLGGTFFAVKTVGRCVDDMIVNPMAAQESARKTLREMTGFLPSLPVLASMKIASQVMNSANAILINANIICHLPFYLCNKHCQIVMKPCVSIIAHNEIYNIIYEFLRRF